MTARKFAQAEVQRNLNATSASEIGSPPPTDVPPAAAVTTYCFPSLPMYVIGVAWPLAGNLADHNSAPVFASKARNRRSFAAPMKTRPLAVEMLPPEISRACLQAKVAQFGERLFSPSGTVQAISPLIDVDGNQCTVWRRVTGHVGPRPEAGTRSPRRRAPPGRPTTTTAAPPRGTLTARGGTVAPRPAPPAGVSPSAFGAAPPLPAAVCSETP